MKQEWIIRVRGRVQGVGFRVFACRLAEEYGIMGTVRNCEDGTVEIVAQGDKLDAFLNQLRRPTGRISIEKIQTEKRTMLSSFDGFSAIA